MQGVSGTIASHCPASCGNCGAEAAPAAEPEAPGERPAAESPSPSPPPAEPAAPGCVDSQSNCETLLSFGYACSYDISTMMSGVPEGTLIADFCHLSCGVCAEASCPDNNIANCDGHCTPLSYVGDFICDANLNCPAGAWDGGDCGECGDALGVYVLIAAAEFGSEIMWQMNADGDWYGNYPDHQQAVRGMCLERASTHIIRAADAANDGWNGGWFSVSVRSSGRYLVHPTFVHGEGVEAAFSTEVDCTSQQVISCSGGCWPAWYVGDGVCDDASRARGFDLNCGENDFDGGDCLCPSFDAQECGCAAGEVVSCEMECAPKEFIADGFCDGATAPFGHNLDCAENDYDGGDCADFCYSTSIVERGDHDMIQSAAEAGTPLVVRRRCFFSCTRVSLT